MGEQPRLAYHVEGARPQWYLGFDCATKTFGYSLSRIDVSDFLTSKEALRKKIAALTELLKRAVKVGAEEAGEIVRRVAQATEEVDSRTRGFLRFVAGATEDLFPGRKDGSIHTVERIRAVSRYVNQHIIPALSQHIPPGEGLMVIIEYQMGANAPARAIAAALVAIFAEYNVALVGPSLKNKIHTCEEGRYCYFAERYRRNYDANKAHAKFNFKKLEETFGTAIPATRRPSLRGHIADSAMQVLGFLVHGDQENAEAHF
jgi:hypothetical protein